MNNSIMSLVIHIASMSCAMRWVLQGEHFTTTFSVGQTEANMRKNRLSSCYKYSKSLMTASSVSARKRFGSSLPKMAFMWGKRESEALCRNLAWRASEKTQRRIIREAKFRKNVEAYVSFYNHIRPHQTLAYKAPARFEELYGKEETQDL